MNKEAHWENIYQTKQLPEVSWYQPVPTTSLDLIKELGVSDSSKIIDVGGGDSYLVDNLLELGYDDITVLDISNAAIERVKTRLGSASNKVKWVVSDVLKFDSEERFDLWHDRAAFHFITNDVDIQKYVELVNERVKPNGYLVIGTFSTSGPLKCSGIEIKQYSEDSMVSAFQSSFEKVRCFNIDHPTPFNTTQNFTFCIFRKREQV